MLFIPFESLDDGSQGLIVVSFAGNTVDSGVIMLWEKQQQGREGMGISNLTIFLCSIS